MKKVLFTLLLAGVISFSASAQTRVGGHLAFGSEIESFGIGAVAEFMIKENMGISPSFTYFFGDEYYNMWELNGNFNYYFATEGVAQFYGLAGLNFANVSYDDDVYESDSNTEMGLNLGIGSNFAISNDKILPYAEIKYVISDYDQLVILAGIKFNLK